MRGGDRRFTIADGMVLIAATAAGLAGSVPLWREVRGQIMDSGPTWNALYLGTLLALPILLAWTVALVALRIRRPRPRWRRVARGPGAAACLAVLVGVLMFLPIYGTVLARQATMPGGDPMMVGFNAFYVILMGFLSYLLLAVPLLGSFVLLTWTLAAVQGWWRPEPTWIDRGGRLVGILWLVASGFAGTMLVREFVW